MLSPTPSEADTSQEPQPTEDRGAPRRLVLILGLVAALAALAFPFASVHQPVVTYAWPPSGSDPTPAAIPLMPYQPVELTASADCAAAARTSGVLLSTVPLRADPGAQPLTGLRVRSAAGALEVSSAGIELGSWPLPAGDCTVTVTSDPARTTVLLDGVPLVSRAGDLRPAVVGAFTEATDASGLSLRLTADTRFQTTISPLKAALAVVCVLALLGMLAALRRADRHVRAPVRALPRCWWRPRVVDIAVTGLLGLWWVIGPVTVDDGYIAGIVRNRRSSGFIGNVYRWLNAPEAPFSWFYDLYYAWSQISPSTVWLRLPSALLGLACWVLLSRAVVPRLLPRAAGRGRVRWLAAVAFAAWWLPFNLGLRPEPWVAIGLLAVFVAVERAIATRAVFPLTVGLLAAGVTTAITPAGLMAFVPFVAAGVPVLRLLRARTDLHRPALPAALVAAPAAALLLMFADQSLAAVLEAIRVRTLIGGGQHWYQEYERYALLVEPDNFQGAIGKRAPVLLSLLAAAGVLWAVTRGGRPGIAGGPARRIVVGFLLALLVMAAAPTKWTQHFGDVAGVGAAVLLLGLVAFSAAALRRRSTGAERPMLAGLGALTLVGALVLAGYNAWPYVSGFYGLTWSTVPPLVAGIPLATLWLVGGGLIVAVLLARSAWRRAAPGPADTLLPGRAPARRVPAPALVALVLVLAVLGLQVLSFVRVSLAHRDGYTLASDALATLDGRPCGLQEALSVETDPAAGALPAVAVAGPTLPVVPADLGGRAMPGVAVAETGSTPWFALDPEQRAGRLPVVVTVSGRMQPGQALRAEFGSNAGPGLRPGYRVVADQPVDAADGTATDRRLIAPADAEVVRLMVEAPAVPGSVLGTPAVASLPRVPRLTPMAELLPAGTRAILDWPVAFVFPCLRPEPLALGAAALAQWRVGPPQDDPAAGITYSPTLGGPFAAPRLLVTEQRMATYLRDDPTRDAAQLYRWVPTSPVVTPEPTVTSGVVADWHDSGRARVPDLDPIG
ncbi:arabinosyltransferase domain-containing protein [Pseudonocardia bannensis]|uniref:Arabinosyltransferase n=1 Tax=Pseudonocardia bannensis TaxID=630973 RepID=A0A848DBH4_9PSEU|nr:arabinosyltransferase domain-containing protein [Pseudonocardia bannensis]NMH90130.1 arabinosyltransferase [Pseudonocardia bannensis]